MGYIRKFWLGTPPSLHNSGLGQIMWSLGWWVWVGKGGEGGMEEGFHWGEGDIKGRQGTFRPHIYEGQGT